MLLFASFTLLNIFLLGCGPMGSGGTVRQVFLALPSMPMDIYFDYYNEYKPGEWTRWKADGMDEGDQFQKAFLKKEDGGREVAGHRVQR